MNTHTHTHTHTSTPRLHAHMLPHHTHTSKSESLSYSVSHNCPRQCIIKVHPPPSPPPLPSSHFHPSSRSLSSAPIYLLSPPALPVTQQLRPANPFWKETTEQKITSPPLSHTPSLPFVFSAGLLLTSLHHHRARLPLSIASSPLSLQVYSSLLLSASLFMYFWGVSTPPCVCWGLSVSLLLFIWDDFSICRRPNSP